MKSKSSTSPVKNEDEIETAEKPGTSKEYVDDKESRGQKRKSEDNSFEETSSKKVYCFFPPNHSLTEIEESKRILTRLYDNYSVIHVPCMRWSNV